MKQWLNWNLKKQFFGKNGIDYQTKMKTIKTPILSISGKADRFTAPSKGCQDFFDAYENQNNRFIWCSQENGFLEDHNHSRILHSKNTHKEIYPILLQEIESNRFAINYLF